MKRLIAIAALACAGLVAQAQTPPKLFVYYQVPGANAWTWGILTLDPNTLAIVPTASGVALKVIIPVPPPAPAVKVPVRKYGQLMAYDPNLQGWTMADDGGAPTTPLPAGVTDVVVHVNGVRYHQGAKWDYTVANGVIVPNCVSIPPTNLAPMCNWDTTFFVSADYTLP